MSALRTRAIALTVVSFVLFWGVVFTQMATGNDPVLGGSSGHRNATPASTAAAAVETTEPQETEIETVEPEPIEEEVFEEEPEPEPEEEEFFEPEPEPEPAPVITSQS